MKTGAALFLGAAVGGLLAGALVAGTMGFLEKQIRDGRAQIDREIASGRANALQTVPTQVRAGIYTEVDTALARAHLTPTSVRAITNVMRTIGIR